MKWGLDNSLLYLLCKIKQKPFKCPDGTIKFLYKNPDDFVKDIVNEYVVGMKISMNEVGFTEIDSKFGINPKELRSKMDAIVEQTRLHMKALYETYSINPCSEKNYKLFQNSIFQVIEMGSLIRTIKETMKQADSLDERYKQLEKLADSGLNESETVKMAQRAIRYSKKDYVESIPLEITGLLSELENKFYNLTNSNNDKKNEKKKTLN